jgi:hypothetical protein
VTVPEQPERDPLADEPDVPPDPPGDEPTEPPLVEGGPAGKDDG